MGRIAIAGVSGYIGTRLLAHLSALEEVQRVVGIDLKPPELQPPKLRFYARDLTQPLGDVLAENGVDSAINLAFVLRPTRDRARAEGINVGGNRNFLAACRGAGVQQVLYLSSYAVYGAHPDNRVPLAEGAPLRAGRAFQYGWDKARAEEMLREFAADQRDVRVTILRCCPVIGPHPDRSVVALMFKPRVMIGVAGYDPHLQFVHAADLVRLVALFLQRRTAGIYNVAGAGDVRYSEAARLAGKRVLRLPERLLGLVMDWSWGLSLQNGSPASGLAFIKYPPLLSTQKLQRETGFEFGYSSREALLSFLTGGTGAGPSG